MYDMMEPVLVTKREYVSARKRRDKLLKYVGKLQRSKGALGFPVWVDFDGDSGREFPRKRARSIALLSAPTTFRVDDVLHAIIVRVDVKTGQYVVRTKRGRKPHYAMLDTPQQVVAYLSMTVSAS